MKELPNSAVSIFAGSMQRITLKEQLAEKLMSMMNEGLICEGDELPSERELSNTLDVSRETVRGAFQLLANKHLLEIAQGSRARVIASPEVLAIESRLGIAAHDVNTVTDARRVIEVAILRAAAINITEKQLRRLRDLIELQQSMFEDPVAFHISDREFHGIIYAAGKNALLESIAVDVYSYALDARYTAMRQDRAIERSVREHKNIYRALEKNDPDAAERVILTHLDSIYKSTVHALQTATEI